MKKRVKSRKNSSKNIIKPNLKVILLILGILLILIIFYIIITSVLSKYDVDKNLTQKQKGELGTGGIYSQGGTEVSKCDQLSNTIKYQINKLQYVPQATFSFSRSIELTFDSTGTTSAEVVINGSVYTIELITATTNSAVIQVTRPDGVTAQREMSERLGTTINGIRIFLKIADSNNQKHTATISLPDIQDNSDITLNSENSLYFEKNLRPYYLDIGAASDYNSIYIGVKEGYTSSYESRNLLIGETQTINNISITLKQISNIKTSNPYKIILKEGNPARRGSYIVLPWNNGIIFKVHTISNSSYSYVDDRVRLIDYYPDYGILYDTTITSEGQGTITIAGRVHNLKYYADNYNPDNWYITLDWYPNNEIDVFENCDFYLCKDTDNGNNINVKGTLFKLYDNPLSEINITDNCASSNYVNEYACKSDGNYIATATYCGLNKICQDGVCVSNPAPQPNETITYFIAYDDTAPSSDIVYAYKLQYNIREKTNIQFAAISNTEQKNINLDKSLAIFTSRNKSVIIKRNNPSQNEVNIANDIVSMGNSNDMPFAMDSLAGLGTLRDVIPIVNKYYPASNRTDICADSDGGKNYYVKGTVRWIGNIAEDECHPYGAPIQWSLKEYFCYPNNTIGYISIDCPSMLCLNGACASPTNCTERWSCSDWSSCSNSQTQSRTCSDSNNCNTEYFKPALTKICSETPCNKTLKGYVYENGDCSYIYRVDCSNKIAYLTKELCIVANKIINISSEIYIKGKKIIFGKTLDGKYMIKFDDYIIVTSLELSDYSSDLYVITSAGWRKKINFLPSIEEINNLPKSIKFESIMTYEIVEKDGEAVYLIKGIKKGKIIGIFPVSSNIEEKINVESISVIEVNKPWWGFLAGI